MRSPVASSPHRREPGAMPSDVHADDEVQRWKARSRTWEDRYKHERNSADQEREWARELEEENEALREQIVRLTALLGPSGATDGEGGGSGDGLCAKCGGSCVSSEVADQPAFYPDNTRQPLLQQQQQQQQPDDGGGSNDTPRDASPAAIIETSRERPDEYISTDDDDDEDGGAQSVGGTSSVSAALDRISEVLRSAPPAVVAEERAVETSAIAAKINTDVGARSADTSARTTSRTLEVQEIAGAAATPNDVAKADDGSSTRTTLEVQKIAAIQNDREQDVKDYRKLVTPTKQDTSGNKVRPLLVCGSPSNPQAAAQSASVTPPTKKVFPSSIYDDSGASEIYNVEKEDGGEEKKAGQEDEDGKEEEEEEGQSDDDDHSVLTKDSVLSAPNQRLFNLVRSFGSTGSFGGESGSVGAADGGGGSVISDIASETAAATPTTVRANQSIFRRLNISTSHVTFDPYGEKAALDGTRPGGGGGEETGSAVGSVVSDAGPRTYSQYKSQRSGKYSNYTSTLARISPSRPSSDVGVSTFGVREATGASRTNMPTKAYRAKDPPQEGVSMRNDAKPTNMSSANATAEDGELTSPSLHAITPEKKWTHPRRQRLQRAMEARARAEREAARLAHQEASLEEQEI